MGKKLGMAFGDKGALKTDGSYNHNMPNSWNPERMSQVVEAADNYNFWLKEQNKGSKTYHAYSLNGGPHLENLHSRPNSDTEYVTPQFVRAISQYTSCLAFVQAEGNGFMRDTKGGLVTRDSHEVATLSTSVDLINMGLTAEAGEVIYRRLQAIKEAIANRHVTVKPGAPSAWDIAQEVESELTKVSQHLIPHSMWVNRHQQRAFTLKGSAGY